MKIGSVWIELLAEGARFRTQAKKEGEAAGAQASTGFLAQFKANVKKSFSGAEIGKGIVQGLGIAGALGAANLASTAVSRLVDVAQQAVQAAIEEEASIAKLGAALKANIPNWDGNTDAIEKQLAARMRLGFADDEQRESLALLVAATKDETRALEIQRTAMDLARLKRIDLKSASEALIKVEGGQFRLLKSLGIQVRKNATIEEALAEVRKAAAGQAEAFADTSEGRLLASQIRVGEALEKLGGRILPLFVAATEGASDAVEDLVLGFDALGDSLDILTKGDLPETEEEAVQLIDALLGLAEAIPLSSQPVRVLREQLHGLVQDEIDAVDATTRLMNHRKSEITENNADIGQSFDDAGNDAQRWGRRTRSAINDTVDALIADAKRLISDFFDPIETRADIYQARLDQNAAEEAFRDAETAREKREATDDILASIRRQADGLLDLGEQQKLTKKDVDTFEKNVKASYAALGKKVPAEIRTIIAKLRELDKWDGHKVNVSVNVVGDSMPGRNPSVRPGSGRAEGGPISPGQPYLVGEEGPELVWPRNPGYVMPHAPSMALMAAAGGGSTVNLELYGLPMQVETPLDVVREIQRATRLGIVPRRPSRRGFQR